MTYTEKSWIEDEDVDWKMKTFIDNALSSFFSVLMKFIVSRKKPKLKCKKMEFFNVSLNKRMRCFLLASNFMRE